MVMVMMQAIKVLNMIKLYGKPIRVNKVLNFSFTSLEVMRDYLLKFYVI